MSYTGQHPPQERWSLDRIAAAQRQYQEEQHLAATQQNAQRTMPQPEVAPAQIGKRFPWRNVTLGAIGLSSAAALYAFGPEAFTDFTQDGDRMVVADTASVPSTQLADPSASASEAASPSASANLELATAAMFDPGPLGRVPAADVTINKGTSDILWVGIKEKNDKPFTMNFPGVIEGTIENDVYMNLDALAFDEATTGQSDVPSFTVDISVMRLTASALGITKNTVQLTSNEGILRSLRAEYSHVTKDYVRQLRNTVKHNITAVQPLNKYFAYNALATSPNQEALINAAVTAVLARYQQEYTEWATGEGLTSTTANFAAINTPAADVMSFVSPTQPELAPVCTDAPRERCFAYQIPAPDKWAFTINPPAAGAAR